MNPCMKMEGKFNESVNSQFKNNEAKQFFTSNNEKRAYKGPSIKYVRLNKLSI